MTLRTSRLVALWAAYVLLFISTWYGLNSISTDIDDLETDVCGAIVLDLKVQAGIVALTNPDAAADILAVVDDVTEECGD